MTAWKIHLVGQFETYIYTYISQDMQLCGYAYIWDTPINIRWLADPAEIVVVSQHLSIVYGYL